MIAYCGLTCHGCAIRRATMEKNQEKRLQMKVNIAQEIKNHYGTDYKPEDIGDCDGCKTEGGRLFSGCEHCHMRKCARAKHIENCAYCDEYTCEKLEEFFATDPSAKKRLDEIRNNL